jgi:serine/threonine protein phosphatase PrpC
MNALFPTAILRPVVGSATHVGCVRKENEDAVTVAADGRLVAVADGMGGHAHGAWASDSICRALAATVLPSGVDAGCEAVADVLAAVNDHILAEGTRSGSAIGSTVVALLLADGRWACLWAGDSRAYLVRDGDIRQLSRDHSQVEELVAAGLVSREQARDHPLGNVVTRAIGVAPGLALDVVEDAVRPGDRFLLCSDGLTKVATDDEIAATAARAAPQAACDGLIAMTLARGAPDNVSVVILDVGSA